MNGWLLVAAISGLLAVVAGAFATHTLQSPADAHALQIFETGARYHMYHTLAIGIAAVAMRDRAATAAATACAFFLAGIVLFSGSLYALALTGQHALAMVTPFGGIAFMAGWAVLAFAATRRA
jgi:uncharacterized membrane protein YgdD (TMEM256/DUF423 family)